MFYPTQEIARDQLALSLLRDNMAFDASDMGVGKTFHGIAVAKLFNVRPFFISPLAVHADIKAAFQLTGTHGIVTNYESLRSKSSQFVQCQDGNYQWFLPESSLLIFDEAHNICNDTENGAIALAARRQGLPIVCMSATLAHTPLDFYILGQMLGLHHGTDFTSWTLKYGAHPESIRMQGQSRAVPKFDPFSVAGRRGITALREKLIKERGTRITKDQFGGFPKVTISPLLLDVGKQAALINEAYEKLAAPMSDIAEKKKQAQGGARITQRLRLRQEIEMIKVPFLAKKILADIARGKSVAVFANFTETLRQLSGLLSGIPHGIISGENPGERDSIKAAFQDDQLRSVLVQAKAGGAGLSLHDRTGRHPRHGYILPGDSIRTMVQVTGRLPRAGSKSDSAYEIVFAKDSVEESICQNLIKKSVGLSLFNDGTGLGCLDDVASWN